MFDKLPGGPYAASYIFDLHDFLTPHVRTLTRLSRSNSQHYIASLIELALWRSGQRIRLLTIPDNIPLPYMDKDVALAVMELSNELDVVFYRMLSPIAFKSGNGVVLEPDDIWVRNGRVWLCWKTLN